MPRDSTKDESKERRDLARDIKDGMFRSVVVPAAYSLEEYTAGVCTFPFFRFKAIQLANAEVWASTPCKRGFFVTDSQLNSCMPGEPLAYGVI